MDQKTNASTLPLVVDLDGTLIAADLFWESILLALKRNILLLFLMPVWLLGGKAKLKLKLATLVDIDAATLPYRADFIDHLKAEKSKGRRLILATGSPEKFAQAVAAHLGIFDQVMATHAGVNLTAGHKRDALVAEFGAQGFDYAGNSRDDIAVFEAASTAIVVAPDRTAAAYQRKNNAMLFDGHSVTPKVIFKLLRVHQWSKNSLIAVPAILANELLRGGTPVAVALGFVAFSMLASTIYIINDLFDLKADRRHKTKRNRPLAAGRIAIASALAIAAVTFALSVWISAYLPFEFQMVMVCYALLTILYTFIFKRMLLIDVLSLAGLYTIRVLAGAAATAIDTSFWLLAFSVFFFLSLALVKRFVELSGVPDAGPEKIAGRGYRVMDRQVLAEAGMASTFSAVLVLALYIDSDEVKLIYGSPFLLWLLCPIVLYISLRIWVLARRDEMDEDPVVFILSDWRSQIMVVTGAALVVAAAAL
jgi:4-hydroxybenzoate polyprenyltransferase/phosphoserine phosphatase